MTEPDPRKLISYAGRRSALGERDFPRRDIVRLAAVSDSANLQRKRRETKTDRNWFASAQRITRIRPFWCVQRLEFLDRTGLIDTIPVAFGKYVQLIAAARSVEFALSE